MAVQTQIQFRRGTAASWTSSIILAAGELGLETDTGKFKIGDGTTVWSSLPYYVSYDSPTFTGTPTAPTATAGTNTTQLATTSFVTTAVAGVTGGFRNAIINGDFRINQRGFTTSATTGAFGFDRWFQQNSGGTVTMSAQKFTTGSPAVTGFDSPNFCRMVVSGQSATSDYARLSHRIEDVRTLAGAPITISFWAKAASGTPSIAIEFEQNFGTGGSPSATVVGIVSINQPITTSWARYTLSTGGVPSLSGKTIGTDDNSYLQLNLWLSGGSAFSSRVGTIVSAMGVQNNTFDIWGVQVQRGQPVSPFEQRPIGVELALCQRYYYSSGYVWGGNISGFISNAANQFGENFNFSYPVTMRSTPTLNGTFTNQDNASLLSSVATTTSVYLRETCANSTYPYSSFTYTYTVSAEL